MGKGFSRTALLLMLSIVTVHSPALGFQIDGRITDQETGDPIPYVTVYINGTARGTITDQMGQFALSNITLPCELILSHISYELKSISLVDSTLLEDMNYNMVKRFIKLQEATVFGDSLKTDYMEMFNTWFLGENYLKEHAEILNDRVLVFTAYEKDQFSVEAHEPIQVRLPLTGYVLKVDLVHFRLSYSEDLKGYHCSILGYYYFDPVDARSGRERRSFARARVQNFYNSSMHFCRSFYHNQLAENGYTLQSTCSSTEQGIPRSDYRFNLKAEYAEDSYGNRMLILTKSSCNDFLISYHENSRQRPVDLSYLDKDRSTKKYSRLSFLSDTVRILPSGRIPENSLLFGGSIGEKRIACLLPEDYIPSMQ